MLRRSSFVALVVLFLAGWVVPASAAPINVYAQLTGDPRTGNPDNLLVDVTITWDPAVDATKSFWTVDVNSPAHPNVKLDEFGFNLVGPSSQYNFSGFDPLGWAFFPGGTLQGSGGMAFMFSVLDPPPLGGHIDVTNARSLTFVMTKATAISASDFIDAGCSSSRDTALGCAQLGAHLQSLNAGQGESDSGIAVGGYYQEFPPPPPPPVPEPASILLFGTALIGAAAARRRRRK